MFTRVLVRRYHSVPEHVKSKVANKNSIVADRFKDQIAIVTGGAKGLGYGISQRLGEEGATLALVDKDAKSLQESVRKLKDMNIKVKMYPIDVTNLSQVEMTTTGIVEEFGKIDVLVQAAGITGRTNLLTHEVDVADFDNVQQINLYGVFYFCKIVLPYMVQANYGRIINIASISGKEGNAGMLAYSTSKAGVIGLTKVIGKEYAHTPITCNAIAPAVVQTPLLDGIPPEQIKYMTDKIPMKRVGTVEEIGALVAYVASREASFVTGFTFDASGGRATY